MKNRTKLDFLSITNLSAKEIWQVLIMAKKLKNELKNKGKNKPLLSNKQMVMIFEKPSLRTKLSFDIAMDQLGGHAIYFGPQEVGMGSREAVSDVAKVISSMADLIVARVFKHKDLVKLANNSKVPVINALSDLEHPCQALADFLTIWEVKGRLAGLTLAYVGDAENNVTHSLCLLTSILGSTFKYSSPKGYGMKKEVIDKAKKLSQKNSKVIEVDNPEDAVRDADVVVTDTWVGMGDEKEAARRRTVLAPYQVNQKLMQLAKPDAIFMHCLPAHRGEEVSAEVIDGPKSVVFQEAENRLHVQKALMLLVIKS